MGLALGVGVTRRTKAISRGEPCVGRLGPGNAAVEREVDARDADAVCERTGCVVTGVAGFLVNLVVRTCYQDIGPVSIGRHSGLVLLVLRERYQRTAHRNSRI